MAFFPEQRLQKGFFGRRQAAGGSNHARLVHLTPLNCARPLSKDTTSKFAAFAKAARKASFQTLGEKVRRRVKPRQCFASFQTLGEKVRRRVKPRQCFSSSSGSSLKTTR